jgi:hypothetical protein
VGYIEVISHCCCRFITLDDLYNLIGAHTEDDHMEKMWSDGLTDCRSRQNTISFDDFKRLMKGQPKDLSLGTSSSSLSASLTASLRGDSRSYLDIYNVSANASFPKLNASLSLAPVVEGEAASQFGPHSAPTLVLDDVDGISSIKRERYTKSRSKSVQVLQTAWGDRDDDEDEKTSSIFRERSTGRTMMLRNGSYDEMAESAFSPLTANRALYRRHREMRLAVTEASKRFDVLRRQRQSDNGISKATLIMQRGQVAPVELQDKHDRLMFEAASRRAGRSARRMRNKTVSDVTGLLSAIS